MASPRMSGAKSDQRASDGSEKRQLEQQALSERMSHIGKKILVLSGKGGVGKSTVAASLAVALARAGKRVGLLDVDIHGPSVPGLFGLADRKVTGTDDAIEPILYDGCLKIMSIGFVLRDRDDPVIWRGPLKMGVIKQFLKDVVWGDLDFLVVDCPPGTGDEPLSVVQLMGDPDGAVIVTTPQEVAVADVRKCINFCRQLHLPVVGVVENMSGFACPHCGRTSDIFKSGGGQAMAEGMNVPFLGRIPVDPEVVEACDRGELYTRAQGASPGAQAFETVVRPILEMSKTAPEGERSEQQEGA